MAVRILINCDLNEYIISKAEVIELAEIIAESYPEPGNYVASFGFLTYKINRTINSCTVTIVAGYGYHSHANGLDQNLS